MRRLALGCLLWATGTLAMAQGVFLQSQHQQSRRHAVLEDDGRMAYLYLTEPGVKKPVRDAVVYTRAPLAQVQDWEAVKRGEPPQLTLDIASPAAVMPNPRVSEFKFRWSADGESVAILRNGSPIAFASSRHPLGYSKAVAVPSPLANPWDPARYQALFQK